MHNLVFKINKTSQHIIYTNRLGAQKFGRATTDNVGKRLAIVLDGKIVRAPNSNEPITSGNGMISEILLSRGY